MNLSINLFIIKYKKLILKLYYNFLLKLISLFF